jgi:hypothetical protein
MFGDDEGQPPCAGGFRSLGEASLIMRAGHSRATGRGRHIAGWRTTDEERDAGGVSGRSLSRAAMPPVSITGASEPPNPAPH